MFQRTLFSALFGKTYDPSVGPCQLTSQDPFSPTSTSMSNAFMKPNNTTETSVTSVSCYTIPSNKNTKKTQTISSLNVLKPVETLSTSSEIRETKFLSYPRKMNSNEKSDGTAPAFRTRRNERSSGSSKAVCLSCLASAPRFQCRCSESGSHVDEIEIETKRDGASGSLEEHFTTETRETVKTSTENRVTVKRSPSTGPETVIRIKLSPCRCTSECTKCSSTTSEHREETTLRDQTLISSHAKDTRDREVQTFPERLTQHHRSEKKSTFWPQSTPRCSNDVTCQVLSLAAKNINDSTPKVKVTLDKIHDDELIQRSQEFISTLPSFSNHPLPPVASKVKTSETASFRVLGDKAQTEPAPTSEPTTEAFERPVYSKIRTKPKQTQIIHAKPVSKINTVVNTDNQKCVANDVLEPKVGFYKIVSPITTEYVLKPSELTRLFPEKSD